MAKRFHQEGRLEDLLIRHAGSAKKPATDATMVKLIGFEAQALHSAAARAMRTDKHFHGNPGPNGWVYYNDPFNTNRLFDKPKKARVARQTRELPAAPSVVASRSQPGKKLVIGGLPLDPANDLIIKSSFVFYGHKIHEAEMYGLFCKIRPLFEERYQQDFGN
jgi:hypothetical protein